MKLLEFVAMILQNVLTGKDNHTYDIARILWLIGVLVYLGLSIYAVIKGQEWHAQDFGLGLGGTLAGGGIGIGMKYKAEPES